MGVLGWILFGLIVGVLAKLIMPGRDTGGIVVTILLGIAGALLGGWFGQVVGLYDTPEQGASFIMALLGSIVILGVYRAVVGRPTVRVP